MQIVWYSLTFRQNETGREEGTDGVYGEEL